MERFSVFVAALVAAVFLIRMIPRLPFVTERQETEANGRPTMSPAELRFYQVLLQCIPSGHEVWAKARLCEYGEFRDGYVDFLITRGGERTPVIVVDFDESTPLGLREQSPNPATTSALPVMRVAMDSNYAADALRSRIFAELGMEMRRAA